jgi:hypothetical protein
MEAQGIEWFNELKEHIRRCREALPIPARETLSPREEWECRITGSSFLQWLERFGPHMLQERKVLRKLMGISPDPFIVFTSNMPGLVAANEILDGQQEQIAFLLQSEFSGQESPDYLYHVHVWSSFLDAPEPEFLAQARERFPEVSEAALRQHREGTMWGRNAGKGGDHLWDWSLEEPRLIEEAFTSWVA